MTVTADALTPSIDATPGAPAQGRVAVHNLGSSEASFTVQVVGLADGLEIPAQGPPIASVVTVSVPAGATRECAVPVAVPVDLATGQHAAAFQITSSRAGDRPLLVPFTVVVESIDQLRLDVTPAPVRGGRSAAFVLGMSNGEPGPISFTLDAEATDVDVRFKTPAFRLLPGEHATTRAKVKGPRHLLGETLQHNLVIAARGRAASTTITTPYIQKPVFAHKFRAIVAGLAVIALWLAAIGGVALWIANRGDDAEDTATAAEAGDSALVQLIDANGDPLENGPYTVLADGTIVDSAGVAVDGFTVDENGNVVDANGNPVNGVSVDPASGTLVDDNGTPIGLPPPDGGTPGSGDGTGGSSGGDSGSGSGDGSTAQGSAVDGDEDDPADGVGLVVPTTTRLRGTVDAGGADLSDITISLAPLDLGAPTPDDATVVGGGDDAPGQTTATKIWSARFAPVELGLGSYRQTEPVAPLEAVPGVDGVWQISDVQLRRTYELSFAKPGFDTQAFVISPPDDGSDVELDVVLKPARGVISGRVVDGGSPLGGVEISLSDGTLTFTTTSATDGDVGAFSFDSVSTPGVYTLVADRSGYGTSVAQVALDPGEQRTDIVVDMDAGVGSISGTIVGERGVPLGGIAVTATSGEVTRTTTTLTTGRVGFYSIPGLEVPATYTVTVDTAGYLPQTRRVPMSGSAGGVDFALVETTATLSGVVSSAAGGGVDGASITLSNADLEFEVTSAVEPQRGAFVVENLPPGNYTVTIERFDHQTATEFVTIRPGVDPPPLLVTLPLRDLTVDAGTGSLVVEVIDPTGETPEERQLTGADIALVETRTGIKKYELLDAPSFTVEFPEVAVGTYTILVTGVDGYNDAAARQVSIGQSQERRTIELLAFGAAKGRMVDSFTGEIITGYSVKFYEQDPDGGAEREIGQAEVNVAGSSDGEWQTLPQVLPAGIYRIEILGSNGYEEPVDQILQAGLPPMQILVEPSAAVATEIPTLRADRYPDIMGRVYEPRLLAGTQTEFDPIDDAGLEVEMSCGGDAVGAVESDEFGAVGSDAFDSFFLSRQAVDANDLLGDCEIVVAAPGYVTQTVDLANVRIGDENALSDRVVNVALVKPVDTFGGRVFWVDDRNGNELPLGGVDITADAVTALTPNLSGPLPPGQVPTTRTSTISSSSAPDGTWTLDGQVFEDARYTFTTPEFAPGSLDVVIDENRTRTVTAVAGMNLTEVSPTSYDVELEPPFNGSISGEVSILSTDTKVFDEVGITGTDPFGNTASDAATDPAACTPTDSGRCIDRTDGDFTVTNAAAGTWTTDFEAPDNHIVFGSNPAATTDSVSQLVGPGQDLSGFDTTFVELGEIEVTAFDSTTGDPITSGATLRVTGGGNPPLEEPAAPGATNVSTIDGILVDTTDPENVAVAYQLEIVVGGYDSANAQVRIDGGATQILDASSIPLAIFAGSKPEIEVRLAPYGSIVTRALGQVNVGGPPTEPLLPDPDGQLEIEWDYVTRTGATINGFDRALVSVARLGATNDFEIKGPPGYYRVNVSHPEYEQTTPVTRPTDNCQDVFQDPNPCQSNVGQPVDVYRLQNAKTNALDGDFVLDVRGGNVSLFTVDDLDDLNIVDGATYRLTPPGGTPGGGTDVVGTTDGNGEALVTGLVPGTWRLELRDYVEPVTVPPVDAAYPVIINITIGPSTATDVSLTNVRASLPPVGGSIVGTLRAENSEGDPVALPTISIIRNFTEGGIEVDGTLVTNSFDGQADIPVDDEFDGEVGNDTILTTPGTTGDEQDFTIGGLATGPHVLTFSEPPGYRFNSNSGNPAVPIDVTSAITATNVGPYEYEVDDISTVTATFAGADGREVFPSLSVKLVPPDLASGGCSTTVDAKYVDASPTVDDTDASDVTVTAEWSNIPPALGNYLLCATDDLHAYFSTSVPVPVVPRVDGTSTLDLTPTANDYFQPTATVARIGGALTKQVGDNNPVALAAGDNASLSISGTATSISPTSPINPATSPYSFDITVDTANNAAGSFTLTLSAAGFLSTSLDVNVAPGRVYDEPIEISNLVQFDVTIDNDPLPGNLKVRLVSANSDDEMTAGSSAGEFTLAKPTGSYWFLVEADGLSTPFRFPESGTITPAASATVVARNFSIPRELDINLTNAPATTSILVFDGDGTQVASRTVSGSGGQDTASVTLAGNTTDTGAIPNDGTLTVRVAKDGSVRTRTATVGNGFEPDVNITLLDLLDVDGTVFAADGSTAVQGASVTATATGETTVTDSNGSAGNGGYDIDNLDNEADGTDQVWTITADKVGVGTGSTQVTVGGASPATPLTGQDITLLPNALAVGFTVTDARGTAPGAAIAGATVTVPGATNGPFQTGAAGTLVDSMGDPATFALPENAADLSYSITHPDYTTLNGTLAAISDRNARNVAERLSIKTVDLTFTVSADVPTLLQGATVAVAGIGSDTTDASGQATLTFDIDADDLTFTVTAADYSYSTSSDDDSERNITNTEIRNGTAQTASMLVGRTSFTFTITDDASTPAAINGVAVTFFGSTQNTGTGNTTQFTNVPVNAADAADLPVTLVASGFDDPGESISASELDSGAITIQMSPS